MLLGDVVWRLGVHYPCAGCVIQALQLFVGVSCHEIDARHHFRHGLCMCLNPPSSLALLMGIVVFLSARGMPLYAGGGADGPAGPGTRRGPDDINMMSQFGKPPGADMMDTTRGVADVRHCVSGPIHVCGGGTVVLKCLWWVHQGGVGTW